MSQNSNAPNTNAAIGQAIVDSYLFVCRRVRSALQTHLGAQHTLQTHRQDVMAVQESLHLHRQQISPENYANMQQGINEMFHHLSTALFTSSDPISADISIEFKHNVYNGRRGRPKIALNSTFLEHALRLRQPKGVAQVAEVSARTVRRRALELGLRPAGQPVYTTYQDVNGSQIRQYSAHTSSRRLNSLTDAELDSLLTDALTRFPEFGLKLATGHLKSHGFRVSKTQLRLSYLRVQGGPAIVGHRRLRRREYNVPGPNSLWHHDGQHGLIRWFIVVHMFIDGKSRLITGAQASNNNRSQTVLHLFHQAIDLYGRPSRVRGDFGGENVRVAEDQEAARGSGTYIWGRSIHNTRIERLWVDYGDGVKRKWWTFFEELENHHGLDINSDAHVWLLHTLFLPALNEDIAMWVQAWNNHPMQLPQGERSGRSPNDQFFFGMIEHGPRGLDALEPVDSDTYGVDWDAMDDPVIRQNLNEDHALSDTRPTEMSYVDVEPSYGEVEDAFRDELLRRVGLVVDLSSPEMDVRTNAWIHGLAIAETMSAN